MTESEDCPIPNTHRRLEQAHYHWHQALDAYDDPTGFQASLNAAIEALRNVTFMLQSEKAHVPAFGPWYDEWRERMKGDNVMKWLGDARTVVVHQADLETTSSARIAVHSNLALIDGSQEFPPLTPTLAIAAALVRTLPEPFASHRADLVLSVERRWSASTLPGWELLDGLAHAYGVLSTIVADAHARAGSTFETRDHDGIAHSGSGGRLPCMITTRESRTVRVALEGERLLMAHRKRVHYPTPEEIPALRDRYGEPMERPANPDDPFSFADQFVARAKQILQADKYHIRMFHIHTPHGWTLRSIQPRDRAEKYALLRALANEVKSLQGNSMIEIAEAWYTPLDAWKVRGGPEGAPDRLEVLSVAVSASDGRFRSYDTVFRRDTDGNIVFDDTVVHDAPMPAYMAPFCDIWGLPIPPDPLAGAV